MNLKWKQFFCGLSIGGGHDWQEVPNNLIDAEKNRLITLLSADVVEQTKDFTDFTTVKWDSGSPFSRPMQYHVKLEDRVCLHCGLIDRQLSNAFRSIIERDEKARKIVKEAEGSNK